jgi:hypothetical protein
MPEYLTNVTCSEHRLSAFEFRLKGKTLKVFPVHAMKAYRAVEVKLNAFLTSVPDSSYADRLTSGERAHGVQ